MPAPASPPAHAPLSIHTHGTPARATVLWLLLIVATVLTWVVGERGASGAHIVAFLAALSFAKGSVVILDFMALRHAPLMWRVLTLGWMALIWALIGFAYWNAIPS